MLGYNCAAIEEFIKEWPQWDQLEINPKSSKPSHEPEPNDISFCCRKARNFYCFCYFRRALGPTELKYFGLAPQAILETWVKGLPLPTLGADWRWQTICPSIAGVNKELMDNRRNHVLTQPVQQAWWVQVGVARRPVRGRRTCSCLPRVANAAQLLLNKRLTAYPAIPTRTSPTAPNSTVTLSPAAIRTVEFPDD